MSPSAVQQPHQPSLAGRENELDLIGALIDRLDAASGVLVFSGEAGVGKSKLLDLAEQTAATRDIRVLRAAGVEFEADLSFLGLNELLLPLQSRIHVMPPAYREALLVALGLGDGPAADRLLVCNAVLALLTEASAIEPILLLVDDLPWLDRASAGVLSFLARRLAGSRIGFIGATRPDERSFFQRRDLPKHRLVPLGTPQAVLVLDLVEQAVRGDRRDEAAAHVRAAKEAGVAAISPRLALLVAGAAAMAAPAVEGRALFQQALSLPGASSWSFEYARIELAYGELLRRSGAGRAARAQLTPALASFRRLGAIPWSDRAGIELRATAQAKSRAGDLTAPLLTPQEFEIASLASQGLTNKEIGSRLFLSHRTVSAHLYRAFPKLDVTSRGMLRDALTKVSSRQQSHVTVDPPDGERQGRVTSLA